VAGREAKLYYMDHVVTENLNGLAFAGMLTQANGTAEPPASEAMLKAKTKEYGHQITAGEDKTHDSTEHIETLRATNITPHVTQNEYMSKTGSRRKSAIDGRTPRHDSYDKSQVRCDRMHFRLWQAAQDDAQGQHRSILRVAGDFLVNIIAYNLIGKARHKLRKKSFQSPENGSPTEKQW
jgi:hypothetical protein